MKTSNWSNRHSEALIRGWVDPQATAGAGAGSVTAFYTNSSGVALIAGDVVIVNSGADQSITTTISAASTVPVGIVQDDIAAGAIGPVLTQGIAALVNTTASVTRGRYAETSTTAKKATENSTRRAGSFGFYLTGGTTPSAYLFGVPDTSSGGGGTITVELADTSGPVSGVSIVRVADFTNNGGGDVSLLPQIETGWTAGAGVLTWIGGRPRLVLPDSTTPTDGLDVLATSVQLFSEHTPGDLTDKGLLFEIGTDYVGIRLSEKDSGTVQIYPDVSGGYDIELKDRGSGKHWETVGVLGTFNLNDMGAGSRAASIVAPAAIANTETVVASISMPANSMQAGTTFRVQAYGRLTSGATPGSSIFRFRIGTTTLTGNIAATLTILNATLVTAGSFVLDMLVTVRTAGAGGTAIGNISATGGIVSAFVGDVSAISATVAVDTTATKLAEFTYISGQAGTTATFENVTIDMAKA